MCGTTLHQGIGCIQQRRTKIWNLDFHEAFTYEVHGIYIEEISENVVHKCDNSIWKKCAFSWTSLASSPPTILWQYRLFKYGWPVCLQNTFELRRTLPHRISTMSQCQVSTSHVWTVYDTGWPSVCRILKGGTSILTNAKPRYGGGSLGAGIPSFSPNLLVGLIFGSKTVSISITASTKLCKVCDRERVR